MEHEAINESRLIKGLPSKIIGSIVFGVVVYLVLSVWALGGKGELAAFNWWLFPVLLGLAAVNYGLRFWKWQYYLRILKMRVPWRDSLIIFLGGFALAITPGKLGEAVRMYFLKRGFDVSVAKSAPILLADRLSDVMALVILSAIGAVSYRYGLPVVWTMTAIVVVVFMVVTVRPLGEWVLGVLARVPWLAKGGRVQHLRDSYEASVSLLEWRRIALPLLLSVVAWGCEALGMGVTFAGLGLHNGLLAAMFIYSFSTIVGAVTMMPGGLGTTEGSITGLMALLNIAAGTAALAAIIIRAATLWFAVAVGVVFLVLAERRWRGR